MKPLSRADILSDSNATLPRVEVKIPEWNGSVWVRTMTAGQRDRFEAAVTDTPGEDIRARLAVLTVCDEAGNLLFTDRDIPALTARSARAVSRVFSVALKLNGITNKDVEELEKNSQAALSGGTSSDSPDILDSPSES